MIPSAHEGRPAEYIVRARGFSSSLAHDIAQARARAGLPAWVERFRPAHRRRVGEKLHLDTARTGK